MSAAPDDSSPPDVPASDAEPEPSPSAPVPAPAPAPTAKPTAPPKPKPMPAPAAPTEEPVVPARDTVGGHFVVGIDGGLVVPFGSIASGVPQSRTIGPGFTVGGDLAYGISRTVMLGVYADVGLPSGRGAASNDSIATIAVGPFVRYHLVQGMAFDPWISGGAGYRRTSIGSTTLSGVDWTRIALGGDWYPASNFGFGPIVELSLGTYFSESPGTIATKALNAQFVLGLRIVFDGPGK